MHAQQEKLDAAAAPVAAPLRRKVALISGATDTESAEPSRAEVHQRTYETYADCVESHDINYGVTAPGQGGSELTVQLVEPLHNLVFDDVEDELRRAVPAFAALCKRAKAERGARRCECGCDGCCGCDEGTLQPGAARQRANAILWRLPTLRCAAPRCCDKLSAKAAEARIIFVAALHAAEEAARNYAAALRSDIVADAAPQIAALCDAALDDDAALHSASAPPRYVTPPERIGAVLHIAL